MANDMLAAFVPTPGFPDCRRKPTCDPRPACPACGGLECLCRPRFFAGQLLTDEDLNRLDHYIVAKNRMHNRHLFGTGVACGLEVVCSVCDPAGNGTLFGEYQGATATNYVNGVGIAARATSVGNSYSNFAAIGNPA